MDEYIEYDLEEAAKELEFSPNLRALLELILDEFPGTSCVDFAIAIEDVANVLGEN